MHPEEPALKRLTLTQERSLNLLPKPSNPLDKLERIDSDPLAQSFIRYQERAQSMATSIAGKTTTLMDYNRRLNTQLRQATDRWNEKFLPVGILSLLAVGGAWRSRPDAPIPIKIGASIVATALTCIICLPQARQKLVDELIPEPVKQASEQVLTGLGQSGARLWSSTEAAAFTLYNKLKPN